MWSENGARCRLDGEIPPEIGNLTNLWKLEFLGNALGCYEYNWDNPDCIGINGIHGPNCCITHCTETDECSSEIPPEIGNMASLEWLDLRGNYLSGEIPLELFNITSLERLQLAKQEYLPISGLTGELPPAIGNLQNLDYLMVQGNRLTGPLPAEICNTPVRVLWAHGNELTGELPECIGYMNPNGSPDNLFSLTLDHNNFSGLIPESWCELDWQIDDPAYGDYFQINNNELCPPYPDCWIADYVGYQDTSNCPSPPLWMVMDPLGTGDPPIGGA